MTFAELRIGDKFMLPHKATLFVKVFNTRYARHGTEFASSSLKSNQRVYRISDTETEGNHDANAGMES